MGKEKEMNRNSHEKDTYRVAVAGSQNFKEQRKK